MGSLKRKNKWDDAEYVSEIILLELNRYKSNK